MRPESTPDHPPAHTHQHGHVHDHAQSHAHAHLHLHAPEHVHEPVQDLKSPVLIGLAQRLLWVSSLLVTLWLVVYWALRTDG